ncbi:prostate-associated microseminoprotein [Ara ararauna]
MAMRAQKMRCVCICLLLSLLLQLPGSQAKCYFQAKAPCEYEGKQFSLGESWLSTNCLLCTCLHPIGVGCCETTQHPIDFPDWCEAHYDSQTCQISVVQKANPSLPCVKSLEHEWGSSGTPEPLINKLLGLEGIPSTAGQPWATLQRSQPRAGGRAGEPLIVSRGGPMPCCREAGCPARFQGAEVNTRDRMELAILAACPC